ncbi:hypothetical protein ACFZBE_39205 [Streptomyces sp. NPDC008061]|uniref:hypothetical protein n=1 Tax=Streptomyces sp. NPDC008061 TaxID=3364805 RepID=UPI0036E10AFF
MGKYAEHTTANLIDMERARLVLEAHEIAEAAALFARNIDSGIACHDADRIAQIAQQFAMRATRVAAMKDVANLYTAERNMIDGQARRPITRPGH